MSRHSLRLFLTICLWNLGLTAKALAQIVPDLSLDDNNSIVTKDVKQENGIADLIEGGTVRGNNIFHSFSEFNVGNDAQVYFANPDGIANILSRVTGNNPTEILGTLGVNGTANLFLLNPNGIVFGENAALDLNGSFIATTAESFEFANGYSYSAADSDLPPLLTVNIPIGLQFGADVGAIEVKGTGHNLVLDSRLTFDLESRPSGLKVTSGSTIGLIGGEVNLKGGNITAPSGKITIGSIDRAGEVGLVAQNNEFSFTYDNVDTFADVNLTQASSLDLSGEQAGNLQIQAQNISLLDNSAIIANTIGSGNSGELNLQAVESVSLIGDRNTASFSSTIFTQVLSGATGNGSNIDISTAKFELQDNASLQSTTAGSGNAGTISLKVQQADLSNQASRSFPAGTGLISRVNVGGTGRGGDINIEVSSAAAESSTLIDPYRLEPGEFQLRGGAKIELLTRAEGEGGKLFLTADRLDILGKVADQLILSSINTEVTGSREQTASNGGHLEIDVEHLRLQDSGQITSNTGSNGRGGNIEITANNVEIIGSASEQSSSANSNFSSQIGTFSARGNSEATGDEGNLRLMSDRLTIVDGGAINSEIRGRGDGGDLEINVDTLLLENGGHISSANYGWGKSGKLVVNAAEATVMGRNQNRASGLFTTITRAESEANLQTEDLSIGVKSIASSNFVINSENLRVQSGGEIVSSTSGTVDAEDLQITATEALKIEDGGRIGSLTSGAGNAGNLNINHVEAIERNTVTIAGARTVGKIDGSEEVIPSSLFSRVEPGARGNGGEINVAAQNLQIDRGAKIAADTFGEGNAGNIEIDANNGNVIVRDSIEIDGVRSGISSRVANPGTGDGGDIKLIRVNNLLVTDGGAIGVDAKTNEVRFSVNGNNPVSAGEVNIAANNIIISGALDDSSSLPSRISAFSEGESNSGTVTIGASAELQILDGGEVSVRNRDLGSAGNIAISAQKLTIDGGQLDAEVNAGNQGNVQLTTGDIAMRGGGNINTQARGSATSGNIGINNTNNVFLENSKIIADATTGNAGSIQINTAGLFLDAASEISASSELGIDGVVTLNTYFDAARSLGAPLPQKPLDPNLRSTQSCETNNNSNNFAYIGRGGLLVNPLDSIANELSAIDWGTNWAITNSSSQTPQAALNNPPVRQDRTNPLTEASAWQINSAEKIELVATTSRPTLKLQSYQCSVTE